MAEGPTALAERERQSERELWKGVFAVTGILTTLVIYGVLQASKKALDPGAPKYKYGLISISNILTTTCQYEAQADIMWLLIFTLVVFLWFASLLAYFPRKPAFLISGENANKSNVLLAIAHPDDESMFFSPTISYLTSRGNNVHILCLSVGDADGKGNIRKEELYQACVTLKVPCQQVKVLDHRDLQDGFGSKWNHDLLSKIVEQEVLARDIHVQFQDPSIRAISSLQETMEKRSGFPSEGVEQWNNRNRNGFYCIRHAS